MSTKSPNVKTLFVRVGAEVGERVGTTKEVGNKHSCTHDGPSLQLERKDAQGANGMLNGSAPGLADAIPSDCKPVNVAPAFTSVVQLFSASSVLAG